MEPQFNHPTILDDVSSIIDASLPWERLIGKTVLVTGAGGLVGSYVVWTLLGLNRTRGEQIDIIASGRDVQALQCKLGRHPRLHFAELPLATSVAPHFKADFVLHLASPSRTSLHRENPIGTVAPNVFGTQALLEMAHGSHAQGFLFVSSGAVYGQPELPEGVRVDEHVPASYDHLNPVMSYAEGKRMGEFLCSAWAAQRGLQTSIARLGHTYGPGLEATDERVFADFAFRILRNEPLVIKSTGEAVRPFCYITDAIVGLFTILFFGEKGEAYNLVNAQGEISMLDLALMLRDLFPEKNIQIEVQGKSSHSFQKQILLSAEKLQALGWRPKVSIRRGFKRTIQSYQPAVV